ncbi:MAG: tetratricopeptide repeat protein [Pyrinomonadaceae bacterium]
MKKISLKFLILCTLLSLLSAGAINSSAQSKSDRKKSVKITNEANETLKKGDYQSAIAKYSQAIQLDPNNAAAHFGKGAAHFYLKETDQSLDELNTALTQGYATPLDIYKLRWSLNFDKKNLDAALDDAQKAAQMSPDNADFNAGIGQIYLAKSFYADALTAFQKAIQLGANNADTYYYAGIAAWHSGEVRKQLVYASEAVKRNTKFSAESYYLIGNASKELKNYAEAIEAYRKTLDFNPDFADAYHDLSDIYRIQNQFAAAAEVAKKGVEKFPNDTNLNLDLSRYYSLNDQSAAAVGAAQQAVKLMPDKFAAYSNLCRAYYEDKQFQPALEACASALKLNPNDGEANVYLAFTNLSLDKIKEANEYFAKSVGGLKDYTEKNPEYADGFYLLGNAYYYAKDPKNAIDAYSKSLQLYPQFAKARFNLGLAYFVDGKVTAAQAQYDALMKQDKNLAAKLKQILDKKNEKSK